MKILFDNYGGNFSTEPHYMYKALQEVQVDATVWANKNISTFDMFDSYKPDVFVTHYSLLTSDTVKYLQQNKSIELVLNITDITDNDLVSVETFLQNTNVSCKFMFTNNMSKKKSAFRVENIMPAADLFIPKQQPSPSRIPFAFVCGNSGGFEVSDMESTLEEKEVYHLIGYPNKSEDLDFEANIIKMHQIVGLYESIMLVGNMDFVCTQLFFDMSLRAPHCGFFDHNRYNAEEAAQEQARIKDFVGFLWNNNAPDDIDEKDIPESIKRTIMRRHTCFNRAERFMKFLGDSEAATKLQQIQNKLEV